MLNEELVKLERDINKGVRVRAKQPLVDNLKNTDDLLDVF